MSLGPRTYEQDIYENNYIDLNPCIGMQVYNLPVDYMTTLEMELLETT